MQVDCCNVECDEKVVKNYNQFTKVVPVAAAPKCERCLSLHRANSALNRKKTITPTR